VGKGAVDLTLYARRPDVDAGTATDDLTLLTSGSGAGGGVRGLRVLPVSSHGWQGGAEGGGGGAGSGGSAADDIAWTNAAGGSGGAGAGGSSGHVVADVAVPHHDDDGGSDVADVGDLHITVGAAGR